MTTQRTSGRLSFAFASVAALLLAVPLSAQTQRQAEPEVIFHVQMLQTERSAADKLAAERTTFSKTDFHSTNAMGIHILRDTSDVPSLVSGETSRQTLEVVSVPKLSTRNGQEARFLVGARKEVPTEPDLLSPEQQNPEKSDLELSERDFGFQLNLRPIILPSGLIRVRVNPRVTSADFSNATSRSGHFVPSLSIRQTSMTYDIKPGQTIALTGLFDDKSAQQLTRSSGVAEEGLLKQLLDKRSAKPDTSLVLLITPEIVGAKR